MFKESILKILKKNKIFTYNESGRRRKTHKVGKRWPNKSVVRDCEMVQYRDVYKNITGCSFPYTTKTIHSLEDC